MLVILIKTSVCAATVTPYCSTHSFVIEVNCACSNKVNFRAVNKVLLGYWDFNRNILHTGHHKGHGS